MWHEIGLALKVGDNVLKGLQHQGEAKSNVVKLNEVIDSWITTKSSPVTWDTLITAIEGPFVNNVQKADEIHDYLTEGIHIDIYYIVQYIAGLANCKF